jgi:membrane-associated phospholipid phosphatase
MSVAAQPGLSRALEARRWIAAALVLVVAIPASIAFLDRPVASFAHEKLAPALPLFAALQRLSEPLPVLASLVLLWTLVQIVRGVRLSAFEDVCLRASVAVCAAVMIKDQLKWAFGRTWPETWVQNNPSYIKDGVYGFFPFHGGQGWYSFPSGHTTLICAAMAVFWIRWPRFRALYAAAVAAVVIGLLGADYHWVSDILAGAALGAAVGLVAADFGTAQSAA